MQSRVLTTGDLLRFCSFLVIRSTPACYIRRTPYTKRNMTKLLLVQSPLLHTISRACLLIANWLIPKKRQILLKSCAGEVAETSRCSITTFSGISRACNGSPSPGLSYCVWVVFVKISQRVFVNDGNIHWFRHLRSCINDLLSFINLTKIVHSDSGQNVMILPIIFRNSTTTIINVVMFNASLNNLPRIWMNTNFPNQCTPVRPILSPHHGRIMELVFSGQRTWSIVWCQFHTPFVFTTTLTQKLSDSSISLLRNSCGMWQSNADGARIIGSNR